MRPLVKAGIAVWLVFGLLVMSADGDPADPTTQE